MENNLIVLEEYEPQEEDETEVIRQLLDKNERGQAKDTLNNATFILQHDPLLKNAFRRNTLMETMDIVKKMPWYQRGISITDTDINNVRLYMEQTYQVSSEKNIRSAIDIVANENPYNPVAEKLKTLEWDGIERIHTALHRFLGAEQNDYNAEVMELHMMAAIHRVFCPGCKYDICLVFVGNQGGGKSTFLRLLAIKDEWFTDDVKKLNDEKIFQFLRGHWIIELSEMSAATKSSIEEVKSFLSRQKDTYRIPYESKAEDRPRQCVVCGTSNNPRFLPLDRTGNRRFAPVMVDSEKAEVHPLDNEKESREYILQMWAEAMVIYREYVRRDKLRLTFSKEMEAYARNMQRECMKEDVLYGRIEEYLENREDKRVCCAMIAHDVFEVMDPKKQGYDADKYTEVMRLLDWKCINTRRFPVYGAQKAWIKVGGPLDKEICCEMPVVELPEDEKEPF